MMMMMMKIEPRVYVDLLVVLCKIIKN